MIEESPNRTLLRLAREFEGDVRAGRVSFLEIITAAAYDLEAASPLCPQCAASSLRAGTKAAHRGRCEICLMRASTSAHLERLALVEAERANATARKEVQRARDRLNPGRARGAGRRRPCTSCGQPLPTYNVHPAPICPECEEQRQRRELARAQCEEVITNEQTPQAG